MIPPREFLAKYLKRDYPDLNCVRVVVIGRDAPWIPTIISTNIPTAPLASPRRFTRCWEWKTLSASSKASC